MYNLIISFWMNISVITELLMTIEIISLIISTWYNERHFQPCEKETYSISKP